MPTYQYVCTSCGDELEAQQSFSDAPLTQCPTCEGRLRKVFGAVGVVFKGSGFYRTDSRAAESKATNGASTDAKPAGATESGSGKQAAKAEAKPAAKKETTSATSKGSAA